MTFTFVSITKSKVTIVSFMSSLTSPDLSFITVTTDGLLWYKRSFRAEEAAEDTRFYVMLTILYYILE